jgi:hypothetical protein
MPAPQPPSANAQQPQQSPALETQEILEPYIPPVPAENGEETPEMEPEKPLKILETSKACTINSDCPESQYCLRNPNSAGQCDSMGTCQDRAKEPCPDKWNPVCGCDGNTYPNKCLASVAGQSIKIEAQCPDSKNP